MSKKMRMIRGDLDYDLLEKKAKKDKEIRKALSIAAEEVKYNTRLYEFLDEAYPWQRKMMDLTGTHTVIGSIAANRVGKSEVGCAIAACHLTGIYPDYWQGRKYDRPIKAIAACENGDLNKTVLQEKLFGTSNWRNKDEIGSGMIPLEFIRTESAVTVRGDDLNKINIKHISGGWSELYFRAYSQGAKAAQGVEADLILIDEQPDDAFWSEAMTRMATTGGHAICAFTPLHGLTGLVQNFMGLTPEEGSPEDKFGHKYRSEDDWASVRASWDDITHIPEKTKATLKKGYQAYEADARVFGIPIAGHGRIFPYQIGDITYDPMEKTMSPNWEYLLSIDIGHGHGRDPSAVIQCAYDKENDLIYVTDEKVGETNTTRELTRMICSIDHQLPVAWPSDANRSSMSSDSSVADQLREQGINLLGKPFMNPKAADGRRNNFKAPGINHINERFAEHRLLISTKCSILLGQIEQYSYDKNGKIQDGNDDAIDSFRYNVMSIIQGYGKPLTPKHERYSEAEEETWNCY